MGLFSVFNSNSGIIENSLLAKDFSKIIYDLEEIEVGFKLQQDIFIFTSKRLIVVEKTKDKESKYVYLSIPYAKVSYFSVESQKAFDANGFLKIWLNGQENAVLQKEFNKSVDVYEVQKILSAHVLN